MKLLYVRHFATINEKMTLLCKNILSLHGKPQKFKCYSLLSKLPIKANDFHKIEKIEFLKTIYRKELARKEAYGIKDLQLLTYLFFSFIFLKSTLM